MVTAAAAAVPRTLEDQLGRSGVMVVPVGTDFQELLLVRKGPRGPLRKRLLAVRFVPLVEPGEDPEKGRST
jgi:protein-L-isoaspartate(D-aspartate) O-methyltransferase